MAQGILVKNSSGQILISSEVETLHLLGQAAFQGTILGAMSDFPTFTADNGQFTLSGRFVHRYAILSIDTPIFFIRPTNYSYYHGILQQFNVGTTWFVDIIQSGHASSPPTIYAFAPPRAIATPGAGVGLKTQLANGITAFDSRLLPLAIYDAKSVIPPTYPCDGGIPQNSSGYAWNDAVLDFDFRSNKTFNSYALNTQISAYNLMFTAPSVAQAVYSRQKNGFKRSSGNYSSQDHWSTAVWWVMYHSTYKLELGNIRAGWTPYAANYWFTSTWESSAWYEGGGSGGGIQTGDRPFNNETINLSNNLIILADATNYGGAAGTVPVPPTFTYSITNYTGKTYNDTQTDVEASVGLVLNPDGTTTTKYTTTGASGAGGTRWLSIHPALTEKQFWVRFVCTSGSIWLTHTAVKLNAGQSSSWYAIDQFTGFTPGVYVSSILGGVVQGVATMQIATDSAGTNIAAQATGFTLYANSIYSGPGDPPVGY